MDQQRPTEHETRQVSCLRSPRTRLAANAGVWFAFLAAVVGACSESDVPSPPRSTTASLCSTNGFAVPERPEGCSFASELRCVCDVATPEVCCSAQALGRPGPNADQSCTPENSKSGARCGRDCWVQCGIQGLGIKVCDCVGEQGEQVYDNCRCPKPEQLAIAAKVPGCASLPAPTGPQQADVPSCAGLEEPEACIERFAGFPCATLWQACVGVDPSAPTDSGSGCVCLPAIDADGSFEQDATVGTWSCGPTNDWFSRDEAI